MKWSAKKFRACIARARKSQAQVSREAGVHRNSVWMWANGRCPEGHTVAQLAGILKCKVNDLFDVDRRR